MKNKKNILKGVVVLLIAISMVLSSLIVTGGSLNRRVNNKFDSMRSGNTLIVDTFNTRIIELDSSGSTIWSFSIGLNNPMDVERLSNGNTLISDTWNNRVIEVDNSGTIVWSISTGLLVVFDAERLSNGNTLITDNNHHRVIEVDSSGNTVWQKTGLQIPTDAERLSNGNTLITDCGNNRIIEVDNSGSIVWSYSSGLNHPTDAERLSNGNTLIAGNNNNNIIEVSNSGWIVWSYSSGLDHPHDTERLSNGNTLISDAYNNRIIEVDNSGSIVWSYSSGLNTPFDAERIDNQPPNKPSINGPPHGKPGVEYTFCITPTDPDGDDFHVKWDWGDGTSSGWSGPFSSGTEVCESHKWSKSGRYIIEVTVKDDYGATVTASLEFIIPRNRASYNSFRLKFFDMFLILPKILCFIK